LIPARSPAINGRVKRILSYTLALSLGWAPMAAAQADATTDVDETTTAEEQSPLAPEQAQLAPPRPLTLDDLIAGAAPYEPPPAPAGPAAPTEQVMIVPAPAAAAPASAYASTPTTTIYGAPVAPPPSAEPRPVFIDDRGATPDAPPTAGDLAYQNRVLGVFRAAQGRQGALDGRWRVNADGVDVYILQFADPGAGESRIEGAWRNVRREGGLDASGFIDQVSRENDEVVVRFTDAARRTAEIRLRTTPDGDGVGRIHWPQGGANVVMTRDVSVETAAFAVPAYAPPPPPPPPKAKPAPSRSKAKATKSRRPAARSRASARRR
jgi:hypothetical protein